MSMGQKLVDAVSQSTVDFFQTMLGTEVTPAAPLPDGAIDVSPCISAAIGLSGDISGSVVIHIHPKVAADIVESWLGESLSPDSADVRDAVGEIANIVLGDAKTTMSSGHINFTISIPNVISGREYSFSYRSDIQVSLIPFTAPQGNFAVEVATKES